MLTIYIYLNRPGKVCWFKSIDFNDWKWHFLSLANTLDADHSQTVAPTFKLYEVTSNFSVVSGT